MIFEAKKVYGKFLFYPKNDQAFCLAKLMRRETLTDAQIYDLENCGFDVMVIGEAWR